MSVISPNNLIEWMDAKDRKVFFTDDFLFQSDGNPNIKETLDLLIKAGDIGYDSDHDYFYRRTWSALLNDFIRPGLDDYIRVKYITRDGKIFGMESKYNLVNSMGYATQIPAVKWFRSNEAESEIILIGKGRERYINKPFCPVTNENVNILKLLECALYLETYGEISDYWQEMGYRYDREAWKQKLLQQMLEYSVTWEDLYEYMPYYPNEIKDTLRKMGL